MHLWRRPLKGLDILQILSYTYFNMKKLITILFTLATFIVATNANQISLYQGDYSSGAGGEFTAIPVNGNEILNSQGAWQTFCIDTAHTFTPNTIYSLYNQRPELLLVLEIIFPSALLGYIIHL